MSTVDIHLIIFADIIVHPQKDTGYGDQIRNSVSDRSLLMLWGWLRFTGMLSFAPMPCVPASLHDMAKMRVGTGQSRT